MKNNKRFTQYREHVVLWKLRIHAHVLDCDLYIAFKQCIVLGKKKDEKYTNDFKTIHPNKSKALFGCTQIHPNSHGLGRIEVRGLGGFVSSQTSPKDTSSLLHHIFFCTINHFAAIILQFKSINFVLITILKIHHLLFYFITFCFEN